MRELSARYWKPATTLLLSVYAALSTIVQAQMTEGIPAIAGSANVRIILICICVFVVLAIRFPRVAVAITRAFLGPADPTARGSITPIFRGPSPYNREGASVFFGRDQDRDRCVATIENNPLTILDGESGCGKTSFLQASVIPSLDRRFRIIEHPAAEGVRELIDIANTPDDVYGHRTVMILDQFRVSLFQFQKLKGNKLWRTWHLWCPLIMCMQY